MNAIILLCTIFAFTLLHTQVAAEASCVVQSFFPRNLPNPNPLVCDGDAGGTQISVFANSIRFKLLGGFAEPVLGFPDTTLPNRLDLVIKRRSNGGIDVGKSFIKLNAENRFVFGKGGSDRVKFRKYFNILQVFVRQFETGQCPIDNKGQIYPELASVRGSLLSLASLFRVKDCSGGNIM